MLQYSRRRKPYTEIGISRKPCCRCGAPARYQWCICADGNVWRPICAACDIALNALVLSFMGDRDIVPKMRAYRAKVKAEGE